MSDHRQDDRLLYENWYTFVQERLELEEKMVESPPGFCVVYETNRHETDQRDAVRYTIVYLGETSVYYHLCKRVREWKELWADWLFHRGNRPEIVLSKNSEYEILFDDLRASIRQFKVPANLNNANQTFKIIYATAVYKTLEKFKSSIKFDTTDALRREGIVCAVSFFHTICWPQARDALLMKRKQLNAALEKKKKIHATQTTTLVINAREIEAYTLECQHLTRICVYKVGQLQGIVSVATFYKDNVLTLLTDAGFKHAVDVMLGDGNKHSNKYAVQQMDGIADDTIDFHSSVSQPVVQQDSAHVALLVHFPHESEVSPFLHPPMQHETNKAHSHQSDAHVDTHSHVPLPSVNITVRPKSPVHDSLLLESAPGPLVQPLIVGVGAFILENVPIGNVSVAVDNFSGLSHMPTTKNTQTNVLFQLLLSILQNQQIGNANAAVLQIGN